MNEEWKPISTAPGYRISNLGRVSSPKRAVMTPGTDTYGYKQVYLGTADLPVGKRRVLVHHLVLEAFGGPRPDGAICRHLNGQRDDNRIENLAWGTMRENAEDRSNHGRSNAGERSPSAKLSPSKVVQIRRLKSEGVTYRSLIALYGVTKSALLDVVKGRTWRNVL